MKIYLLKRKGQLSKENHEKGRSIKISLYLLYHFGPGQKREYEWLDLFLYDKPKNQIQKDHNKITWQLAETIKAKKMVEDQTTAHGFISKIKSRFCFVAYFKTLVDTKESTGNYGNWLSTHGHLVEFTKGRLVPLETVDERFLESFKEYLLTCKVRKGKGTTKLNKNSASSYFNKVRAALRNAFKDRMIKDNPALRVKCITGQSTQVEWYKIENEFRIDLPAEIVLYSILDNESYGDSISFKELQSGYNAPGNVFALNEDGLYNKIERIVKICPDAIYTQSAGVRELQFKSKPDKWKILNEYYSN